ncbi:MAG: response regulator [Candidatus Sericytochromatia bacterium]|nr:response regulator [Candidatus Sericytochromatia bacterium]
MDQKAVLDRLRRFVVGQRYKLGMTQAGLASRSGVSKPTISRLEQGTLESVPKITTLEKLSRGLEVRFEDLESLILKGEGMANQAKARVLIVEDEDSLCRLWTMNLNRAGYATVSTNNGEEALALINYAEPDVIILDMMIPGISGLDLLRYLRRDLNFKGAVIVVTARDEQSDGEYVNAGASQVIYKGDPAFSNQLLLTSVQEQLAARR